MRQLSLALTSGQILQAQRQAEAAMQDTTCIHCWLRQQIEAGGYDPDYLPDFWEIIRTSPPAASRSLLRLLMKDTCYVEDHNARNIAHMLKLDEARRVRFFNLNYRNRQLSRHPDGKNQALSFCLRS